jgi:cell division initiation protein
LKITPLDIRRQEFNRKVRGLDSDEVEAFLETVANEFEAVIRENASLKEQIGRLDSQVAGFRELEKTLQDTLVSAQKARDEARSDATKEAECIVREAELKAERWIEEARQEVMTLKRELSALRNHKATFIAKMRALLSSQDELLHVLELDSDEGRKDEAPSVSEGRKKDSDDVSAEETASPFGSDQSEMPNQHGQTGKTHPAPPPSPTDGSRRPYRRFFGGRNPQGERHGSSGEGEG